MFQFSKIFSFENIHEFFITRLIVAKVFMCNAY